MTDMRRDRIWFNSPSRGQLRKNCILNSGADAGEVPERLRVLVHRIPKEEQCGGWEDGCLEIKRPRETRTPSLEKKTCGEMTTDGRKKVRDRI